MSQKPAAIAYIGSRIMQLTVAEIQDEKIHQLDYMETPLDLGHQTFTTGRIQYETVDSLCERLNAFKRAALGYGIENMKVFATTALREAINRHYVIDQIKIMTELDVEIIEDAEEKRSFYDEILQSMESNDHLVNKDAIIAYIGTGSIGVTYFDSKNIVHTQNIPLGTLSLRESLGDRYREASDFYIFMEEYLANPLQLFKRKLPKKGLENFIVSGKQSELLANFFDVDIKDGVGVISKKTFMKLYDRIKHETPEQISFENNLRLSIAEIVLPTICIYKTIFEMTSAEYMTVINTSFVDILTWRTLMSDEYKKRVRLFRENTVASARFMAYQYNYSENHSEAVEQIALAVFDQIRPISGLGKKDRLLLQVAAILHSLGEFEGTANYQQIVYDMLKCFSIVGLRKQDMIVIAEASYKAMHDTDEGEFIENTLSKGQQVKITKMAAILEIAEALDISRKQKFNRFDINYDRKTLKIKAATNQNFILEEWDFTRAASWFRQIFGIEAKLTVKRCYDEI